MSMTACPGCGLPRAEDQLARPCPVCDAGPGAVAVAPPVARPPSAPDPTKNLPADVSAMNRAAASAEGFPAWFRWAVVFAVGVGTGAAGVFAWQANRAHAPTELAQVTPNESRPLPPLPSVSGRRVEVAPVPHEPTAAPEPEPEPPPPEPRPPVAAPDKTIVIELNLPNGTYHLPFAMKKGERVVLKGKVNSFRARGLDGGAVLDASGLEAAQVYIGGKIDNGSTLKVNAPNGTVTFAAAVGGKSKVEIAAPGGDVTFSAPTTPARPGSAIDGGSTVTIAARTTDLRGDVNGSATRVSVSLPRNGTLKAVAVRGTATVEYRVADGKGTPDVSAGFVSPAATFKKVE
ncbi:unnamed protein product [Gemmataceae bacterium]|nr:unnamed protein product [Gemmataceae bacterium]VTT97443.1 unnamed protein product [Gemmataceae bacterium]